jgi:predicted acyltransferase (DUF342 family)
VEVPPETTVTWNFVARKNLLIRAGSILLGSVKAYGNLKIEDGCIIRGHIFAEGEVEIGPDTVILGNVFSQDKVRVGSRVQIGNTDQGKSVIGKKSVQIGEGATIFSYVLTEGPGVVL